MSYLWFNGSQWLPMTEKLIYSYCDVLKHFYLDTSQYLWSDMIVVPD